MVCPLCQQRQARRACPAVGQQICAVCCGTKRQVEIACPPTCGYLAAAQAHPPASVRRQQERDVGFLMAMREGLSNRESELFWVVLTFLAGYRADPLVRLVDEDLAEGAGSLAATYETANRGLIYEHRPQSLASQRLVTDLKAFLATLLAECRRVHRPDAGTGRGRGAAARGEGRPGRRERWWTRDRPLPWGSSAGWSRRPPRPTGGAGRGAADRAAGADADQAVGRRATGGLRRSAPLRAPGRRGAPTDRGPRHPRNGRTADPSPARSLL